MRVDVTLYLEEQVRCVIDTVLGGAAGLPGWRAGGSTSTFQLTLASYLGPPDPGNDIVAVLPYVNGGPAGQPEQAAYVFYAAVPITPAKTVQAVTLPRPGSGPPGGMHIFAVAIGPLRLPGTPPGASD